MLALGVGCVKFGQGDQNIKTKLSTVVVDTEVVNSVISPVYVVFCSSLYLETAGQLFGTMKLNGNDFPGIACQ